MAVLGISLIVASVVWVIFRPPTWAYPWLRQWTSFGRALPGGSTADGGADPVPVNGTAGKGTEGSGSGKEAQTLNGNRKAGGASRGGASTGVAGEDTTASASSIKERRPQVVGSTRKAQSDRVMMPPPPPPPSIQVPTVQEPDDEQTTPKAEAARPSQPVPSFSLSEPQAQPTSSSSFSSSMGPPPLPSSSSRLASPSSSSSNTTSGRLPTLQQFPAAGSIQRASGPVPNRGPPPSLSSSSSASGLAPPPTHSSKPKKPSRKVILTPGHSPLDWARISGPAADLRGVAPSTPYLRVTPSMLKKQTGRKGTDAWMGLNGKVYNISPYADYHPGGKPELMRGAGRDGTKLFGEVHPWVNYENMLSACLIGLMVEEPLDGNNESEMDKMD